MLIALAGTGHKEEKRKDFSSSSYSYGDGVLVLFGCVGGRDGWMGAHWRGGKSTKKSQPKMVTT